MKTIAHITDIHFDEEFPINQGIDSRKNWERILADVMSRDVDEIVFGGDIGMSESHEWFLNSLKETNIDFKIILGNHDTYNQVRKHYQEGETNELCYSSEDTYFKYLYLDSSKDYVSDTQLDWLNEQLDTSKKIILFIHHPVLFCDTILHEKFPLKNRDVIKTMLHGFGNEVNIFCGHYHLSDEVEERNIKQFITPASSYLTIKDPKEILIDNKHFGYRIVGIDQDVASSRIVMFD